ncbi:MAG: sulfite exporter TauE/SafE family protein [Chloroflexi bacterium]|nr:sulfite exporter TauE/SafE family protein [Chloroflexota bacterium]
MDVMQLLGLGLAAALAGAVNAVAGGGTLISFPSLLAVGLSAKVANMTSTVAIWPGTVAGSLAYRKELSERTSRLKVLSVPSIAGALVGSFLLLVSSERVFDAVVPFLIIFASVMLALNARLSRLAARHGFTSEHESHMPPGMYVVMFLVGIYGGYFGAGIGILMLAAISILAPDDLQHSNAVKGLLGMLMNFTAVVVFSVSGLVEWGPAAVMAVGAIVGGYGGVAVARRLNANVLRALIVAWGLFMGVYLLLT